MNIHVFLTIGPNRLESGIRMLQSIDDPLVFKHVLWREFTEPPKLEYKTYFPETSESVSLSRARNILILNALNNNLIKDEDVVCFADDDGLWPQEHSILIRSVFESKILWAIGTYGPGHEEIDQRRFPPEIEENISIETILLRTSSLGLYVRGSALKRVGKFNEYLGVGSTIESGEDTEYAIRLFFLTQESTYHPELFQYHEYGRETNFKRQEASFLFLWYLYFNYSIPFFNPFRRTLSLFLRGKVPLKSIQKIFTISRMKNTTMNMVW